MLSSYQALGSTSHRKQRPLVTNPFNILLHPKDITVLYLSSLPLAHSLSLPFPPWRKVAVPFLAQGPSLSRSSKSPILPLQGTLVSSFSLFKGSSFPIMLFFPCHLTETALSSTVPYLLSRVVPCVTIMLTQAPRPCSTGTPPIRAHGH